MSALRERVRSMNTLACFLQGMQGQITMMELRNENKVHGKIDSVDSMMNTYMSNVTFTTVDGQSNQFDLFYIKGKQIRYVHIPDEVDVIATIQAQLAVYGVIQSRTGPGMQRAPRRKIFSSKEQKQRRKAKIEQAVKKTAKMLASLPKADSPDVT